MHEKPVVVRYKTLGEVHEQTPSTCFFPLKGPYSNYITDSAAVITLHWAYG